MPIELPDLKTAITKQEALDALWRAWMAYFGAPPARKESIWVICSQWALETKWGESMHNYNMGNVKSKDGDGYDFQYYGCGEEILLAEARRWIAADPGLVKVVRSYTAKDGRLMASVWVDPKHWACRFRAFNTLVEGAVDYVGLLVKRFNLSWEGVERGDPALFSRLLHQQGYYTADVAIYTKTMTGVYAMFAKMPFDYDTLPIFTESEKDRISNLVSLTVWNSVGEALDEDDLVPDDDPKV
jgi:hypothetical protein